MVQFASYLRGALCKTRLIFPRINGPNVTYPKDMVVLVTPIHMWTRDRITCSTYKMKLIIKTKI